MLVNEFSYVPVYSASLHDRLFSWEAFSLHPLGTLPPFIGFLLVSRVGLWLQWTRIRMNWSSDEYVKRSTHFNEDTFYDVTFMKVYIFINTELSTENITSTLLRVFYIFAHCKILRILVSLNFLLIRKNP